MQSLQQVIRNFSKIISCASVSLLCCANPAKAILNINIYDDGPNLKVETSGILSALGTSADITTVCNNNGALAQVFLCTGVDTSMPLYLITGPGAIGASSYSPASSVLGPSFLLTSFEGVRVYGIDPSYVLGQPFLSSATFNNTSAAAKGFTVPGLIATWTINGTSESINLFVGPPSGPPSPPSAAVPGPLPLVGAGAAFGWSRRMRRRISLPLLTPPQA
ncbi:MAG: hypothetical protein ACKO8I_07780 [Cyanobacteriota bacterium]